MAHEIMFLPAFICKNSAWTHAIFKKLGNMHVSCWLTYSGSSKISYEHYKAQVHWWSLLFSQVHGLNLQLQIQLGASKVHATQSIHKITDA